MAGPWERFQQHGVQPPATPAVGPWTRFQQAAPADFSDVQSSASTTANRAERYAAAGINPQVRPTDGESFLDNAAAGFGAAYVDTKDAVRQLMSGNIARPVEAVRHVLDWTGAPEGVRSLAAKADTTARGYRDRAQADIDERKRLDSALKETKGGQLGGIAGFVSQLLAPAGALRGVAATGTGAVNALANIGARALLPATVKGSAAQGAVLGALQPVATGDSRTGNALLGLAGGAGGAALGQAIGAGFRASRNALAELTGRQTQNSQLSRLAEIIRQEASDANSLLRPQPSAVPGVQRSLAEESLDAGIARLERLLRSKGGAWDDLDRANNSSRVNALAKFAGDSKAVEAAKRQRDASAFPLLDQALEVAGVNSKPVLNALAELTKKAEGRPAIQNGLSQISSLMRRTAKGAEEGAEKVPEDRLSVLYNVRKTIGDMLEGKYGGESAAALAGSRELLRAREALDEALTAASPEFGQYLSAFREGSIPIGRMEIGQSLMERGGAIPDAITGNTVLTPAQFSRASGDLDRVAAQATGFRKAKAEDYLEPEDLATISAIQDDLQRRAFASSAGSGGNSQTAERIMGNDRLSRGFANRIAARIPGFGAATEYLREVGQQRLEGQLAEALMNPGRARSILLSVPAEERRALQTALARAGNIAGAITADSVEQ